MSATAANQNVTAEESWTGKQIEADPATSPTYLAPGLDAWLADLKAAAERT
ncbi:hypothetical protein ACWD4B_30855 [Streptomyces sp. NPDC002536]